MKTTKVKLLTAFLALSLAAFIGCSDKKKNQEPFSLTVISLEITGEVDDVEITEVDVDGEKWAVTDKEFSGTVSTTGKDTIEIEATDTAGNTGKKTIEIQ